MFILQPGNYPNSFFHSQNANVIILHLEQFELNEFFLGKPASLECVGRDFGKNEESGLTYWVAL